MKKLSKIALSVRHPLATATIMEILGCLIYSDVTIGRLVFSLSTCAYVIIGTIYEEKDTVRRGG